MLACFVEDGEALGALDGGVQFEGEDYLRVLAVFADKSETGTPGIGSFKCNYIYKDVLMGDTGGGGHTTVLAS